MHAIFSVLGPVKSSIVNLETRTYPSKMVAVKDRLEKVSRFNAFLGSSLDYERIILGRQSKEGLEPDFEVGERKNGLVRDNGIRLTSEDGSKEYLSVYPIEGQVQSVEYYLDGKSVNFADIEKYLPKKSAPKQGGIQKKVIYRDFKVESVKAVTVGGTRWTF